MFYVDTSHLCTNIVRVYACVVSLPSISIKFLNYLFTVFMYIILRRQVFLLQI